VQKTSVYSKFLHSVSNFSSHNVFKRVLFQNFVHQRNEEDQPYIMSSTQIRDILLVIHFVFKCFNNEHEIKNK
jgi:hypothetical protein